jgi:hypothetical protein
VNALPLAILAELVIELMPIRINAERIPITTITTKISIKVKEFSCFIKIIISRKIS